MINITENNIMKNWEDSNTPLVSICCITYNHENYIAMALDNFLTQETNFSFEIIVRDDCSTDKTAEIIRKYEKKFPNIIKPIYEIENQFSKGFRAMPPVYNKSKGKYFAVCEGDDFWTDNKKLQKQVDFLSKNEEYTGCFHDCSILIEENNIIEKNYLRIGKRKIEKDVNLSSVIYENNIATASIVFRREIIATPKYRMQTSKGDYALMVMIAAKGLIKFLPYNMSSYRVHPGGIWSSKGKIYHEWEALKFYNLLNEHFHDKKDICETISKKIKLIYYNLSILYAKDKKRLNSLYYLFLSFSFNKSHKDINYIRYFKVFILNIIR